ncbi:MAG TPA: PEP-CTERM/exosortase system-associated acyltransferase [Rhizomicrobium sp.]|nr:PEP-CTERM/exosortase system-associated acyltransferase [Rhizomicrobium sp.]
MHSPSGSAALHNKYDENLVDRFDAYFELVSANTRELIDTAFALRYQVYCLERQFEDPAQQRDGLESDQYDSHAVHCLLLHRPQAAAIGTARLILPQARPNSLPIQQLLKKNGLNSREHFSSETVAEISRFAISKEFRRRVDSLSGADTRRDRLGNLPFLGLLQILLRQSVELGVDYWAAVMEPTLLRMLAAMGVRFHAIGPLVSYHGLRQPSYCYLPQMLRNLALTRPECWAVVTNNGELMCEPAAGDLRRVA